MPRWKDRTGEIYGCHRCIRPDESDRTIWQCQCTECGAMNLITSWYLIKCGKQGLKTCPKCPDREQRRADAIGRAVTERYRKKSGLEKPWDWIFLYHVPRDPNADFGSEAQAFLSRRWVSA